MAEFEKPGRMTEGMTFMAPRLELIRPEPIRFNLPAQPTIEAQRVRRTMLRTPRDGRR